MLKLTVCMAGLTLAWSLSAQVEPNAVQWQTSVIASRSAMRLQALPDSDATTPEIQSLRDSASQMDPATLAKIHFWDAEAPGVWSCATPVAPLAGNGRPWEFTAGNQFRPGAPPAWTAQIRFHRRQAKPIR